jgi:hypothetical protein
MTTSGPDDRPPLVDPRVGRAWREVSREEPPASVDAALLAAALRDAGAKPQPLGAREARAARRQWWPLAAAATVAAIPSAELSHERLVRLRRRCCAGARRRVAPQSAMPAPPVDETSRLAATLLRPRTRACGGVAPTGTAANAGTKATGARPVRHRWPEPLPDAPKLAANAAKPSAAPLANRCRAGTAAISRCRGQRARGTRGVPARRGWSAETVAPPMARHRAPRLRHRLANASLAPPRLRRSPRWPRETPRHRNQRRAGIKQSRCRSRPDPLIRRLRDLGACRRRESLRFALRTSTTKIAAA